MDRPATQVDGLTRKFGRRLAVDDLTFEGSRIGYVADGPLSYDWMHLADRVAGAGARAPYL